MRKEPSNLILSRGVIRYLGSNVSRLDIKNIEPINIALIKRAINVLRHVIELNCSCLDFDVLIDIIKRSDDRSDILLLKTEHFNDYDKCARCLTEEVALDFYEFSSLDSNILFDYLVTIFKKYGVCNICSDREKTGCIICKTEQIINTYIKKKIKHSCDIKLSLPSEDKLYEIGK